MMNVIRLFNNKTLGNDHRRMKIIDTTSRFTKKPSAGFQSILRDAKHGDKSAHEVRTKLNFQIFET